MLEMGKAVVQEIQTCNWQATECVTVVVILGISLYKILH